MKGGDIIDIVESYRRKRKRRLWQRMKNEPNINEAARLAKILYVEYFKKPRERNNSQKFNKNVCNSLTSENTCAIINIYPLTPYREAFRSLDCKDIKYLAEAFAVSVEAILSASEETLKEFYELICEEAQVNIDADDDVNWITTKDGIHIPLNDEGKAVGGPLEGKSFSLAKSEKSTESGATKSENKGLSKYIGKPIVETDNQHVREWYVANVSDIPNQIDTSKPFEEQVKQAFELRNNYKYEARVAMSDTETAKMLERKRPAPTFDELLEKKMKSKGLEKGAALEDILKTASTTNDEVNKEFGL